jgi:hypothetical protein
MHVERYAMYMDVQMNRHPCVRRDPGSGGTPGFPHARE